MYQLVVVVRVGIEEPVDRIGHDGVVHQGTGLAIGLVQRHVLASRHPQVHGTLSTLLQSTTGAQRPSGRQTCTVVPEHRASLVLQTRGQPVSNRIMGRIIRYFDML
jgi:hypothetical protein